MQRQRWHRRGEPLALPPSMPLLGPSPALSFWQLPAYIGLVTADQLPSPTHPSVRLSVLAGVGSPTFIRTTWLQLRAWNVSGRN